jgi:ribonuclease HI
MAKSLPTAGTWKLFIDGASRGNPGRAAYAVVIERPDSAVYEEADVIGVATNNVAEYTALLRGLQRAAEMGARRLMVYSDSELLVKQMNGEYRVKSEQIQPLFDEANDWLSRLDQVTIQHVRRAENSRADQLCNEALDGRPKPPTVRQGTLDKRSDPMRERALEILRQAAESWSRGDPHRPTPESVWNQLESLWRQSTPPKS